MDYTNQRLYEETQWGEVRDNVNYLAETCAVLNDRWWRDPATNERIERNFGELIALMHSELSEALEGHRTSKMDDHCPEFLSVEVELADALIRILDTAHKNNMRIGEAFVAKCMYNLRRKDHTHAARLAQGGKKY